jgi:hypothetical protein
LHLIQFNFLGYLFGIKQQFPQEIENRRKQLYSIQRNAKREGKRVTLVRDRLYINNELYIVPEEIELNEMQEDAFEIDQGNLEDDFIPYRYASTASITTKAIYITEFNFVVYSQFTI